ncbi:ATP-binding protein [Mesorhizobium sp. B1-1-8]|uniref:ATP-binding protein n=1 Tax=Mesorhizobium sp. B1-1-8 TaxID=2589976 RepID=UPI0015E3C918|nr:HAMP domain-containing sensor histidine kinase [Mesorhizobium sp. B1-1-8]UCI05189.1 HAMP domain-containing histidine kinase [Mesorhizobium sp. B1-1-8]
MLLSKQHPEVLDGKEEAVANDLGVTSRKHVSDAKIAFPTAHDPRFLLASIVHDFNGLLTPILAALEEMQSRSTGTSRQLRKIDGAIYCAFQARTLARQMIELAIPRVVKLGAADIRRFLERIESPHLMSNDVRLQLDIERSLPKALVDKRPMEWALLNLILNAREAMPKGGHVAIVAAKDDPSSSGPGNDDPMIRVTISDCSLGTDEAKLRAEGDTSTKNNGTEIALVTVRELVERHGGRLSIVSASHRGTTIDLWLPVK